MQLFIKNIAKTFLLTSLFVPALSFAQKKEIFGWVEKVRIYPADIVIHAKIDSGADYSSLSASEIDKFMRGGAEWVRFTLKNRYGHKAVIEKKIVRVAKIKRHGGESNQRYVIRVGLCLGSTYMEEEVNLADRSQFDYQMLIGRSFLSGNVLIDPAQQYTIEPNCANEDDDEDENEFYQDEDETEDSKSLKSKTKSKDDSSESLPHQFNTGEPHADLTGDLDKSKPIKTKSNDNAIDTSEENWGGEKEQEEEE